MLIGFVVFVGVAGVLSIKNVSKVKEFEKNQIAKVDNKEIDRRLEQFLDSYVSYYFTYKAGEKDSEENAKRLSDFYGTPPSVKNQGQSKQDMSIVSGRLLMAKDGVAVYAVTYDTKVDNNVYQSSFQSHTLKKTVAIMLMACLGLLLLRILRVRRLTKKNN